jgi:diaminopimelate epimerase
MKDFEITDLEFEKYHGLGNDYIIINNLKYKIPEVILSKLAKTLCKSHFSIGADGLLLVFESQNADIRMRIFNNDGTESEMCGNGIRCFSKYIYEHNIVKKEDIKIETLKGIIIAKLRINKDTVSTVQINMGRPILDCEEIPVEVDGYPQQCINEKIVILDKVFNFSAVSMGNPHAVIFTKNLISDTNLNKYGANIESDPHFPRKTNVEFVQVISNQEAYVRVFERGVGITNSCGTGSCAAVVAGVILGIFKKNEPISVHNDGGDLTILYDGKEVFMEGPAIKVFTGYIEKLVISFGEK